MKQKDLALILVVGFVSAIVSFFASHLIFTSSANRHLKVEKVDAISTEFKLPDSKYFNRSALDPTQLIRIGDNENAQPFNGTK